jgi:hypothetical protein
MIMLIRSQIKMARPSYVNALLIASRGIPMPNPCEHSTNGLPFGGNVRLPGTFNGACANCQWRDHASQCTLGNRHERQYISLNAGEIPEPSRVETLVD